MMCYRDMTFCTEQTCKNFGPCPRSLTDKVKADAEKWMKNAPISMFGERPSCYETKEIQGAK